MKTINYKLNKIVVILPLCIRQLIREDNEILGFTYLYEYDNAGNITAVNLLKTPKSEKKQPVKIKKTFMHHAENKKILFSKKWKI